MSITYDVLVADDRMLDAQETLVALEQVAPRATVLHLDSGREALAYLFSVGEFAGRPPVDFAGDCLKSSAFPASGSRQVS